MNLFNFLRHPIYQETRPHVKATCCIILFPDSCVNDFFNQTLCKLYIGQQELLPSTIEVLYAGQLDKECACVLLILWWFHLSFSLRKKTRMLLFIKEKTMHVDSLKLWGNKSLHTLRFKIFSWKQFLEIVLKEGSVLLRKPAFHNFLQSNIISTCCEVISNKILSLYPQWQEK